MLAYFVRKILSFATSVLLISSITFFLMKALPGDPFSEEQVLRHDVHESLRQQHGFNRPWYIQYSDYLKGLLHGNLGYSIKYPSRSVTSIIQEGFLISASLGIQAFCLALILGLTLGTMSAFASQHWQDRVLLVFTTMGLATPSFILAALLQYLFAIAFPLFPLARYETFAHTILPSIALAMAPTAIIARLIRAGLIEVLQTDYVKLAKAKGLPRSLILWRHALRNAMLPVLSYLGPLLVNVLVGSFVIEKIFSIPGLGQWFVNSVANRDYPLIMGLTLFFSLLLLFAVLVVDLLYSWCDPRIRLISEEKIGR